MANSITGWNTFVAGTKIQSAPMNSNLTALKNSSPIWQKYSVSYATLAALGATASANLDVFTIGAGDVLDAIFVKHGTLFTGTSITGATFKCGKTGAPGSYTDEFDVKQAVGSGASQMTSAPTLEFSATTFIVTMSLTGGVMNQLSQGSVDVWVRRAVIP